MKLKNDFDESNLPYFIDLVDFSLVEESFKKFAKKNIINL